MTKYNVRSFLSAGKRSVYKKISPALTRLSARWLKFLLETHRKGDAEEAVFSELGIRPVLDHYYQPLINPQKHLKRSLRDDRSLPGIDFNDREQLALLEKFDFNKELLEFPLAKRNNTEGSEYFYNNGMYASGDAEYLYNMIRHFKPARIIEIGSGQSTLMAINAIEKNRADDQKYQCEHTCIEPFEESWLETKNIKVIRSKVEELDISIFKELVSGDILFIDSSHMIRPQGDVLFEFLEILPVLKPRVIVHVHDIFTPKDYPDEWVLKEHRLWNEQYLLEAFLSLNDQFKIIGATNYLSHHYPAEFSAKCPVFAQQPGREPGAFWMRRV